MALQYLVDRVVNLDDDGNVTRFIKVKADSTDKKPVDYIAEGSTWYDRDTAKWYIFNLKQKKWIVPDDFDGSSSGDDVFTVRALQEFVPGSDSLPSIKLDKTWNEIKNAVEAGKFVVSCFYDEPDTIYSDLKATAYSALGKIGLKETSKYYVTFYSFVNTNKDDETTPRSVYESDSPDGELVEVKESDSEEPVN